MLIETLDECIIEMNNVRAMETASSDTKKQIDANVRFKKAVAEIRQILVEVCTADEYSGFKPSAEAVLGLKRTVVNCGKVLQAGAAENSTTQYISSDTKKAYEAVCLAWAEYYKQSTMHILRLLDTIKCILPDDSKITYAANKIKKAANWSKTADNYKTMQKGLEEAEKILADLDLDENLEVLTFLRLVSMGKATMANLTEEILAWIKSEGLEGRMHIRF